MWVCVHRIIVGELRISIEELLLRDGEQQMNDRTKQEMSCEQLIVIKYPTKSSVNPDINAGKLIVAIGSQILVTLSEIIYEFGNV